MENIELIHLKWEKHLFKNNNFEKFDKDSDFGIYQIYGDHPVYGENTLLYIGKAQEQTFAKRIAQHFEEGDFTYTHIPYFSRFHLGYFLKAGDVNDENWKKKINTVESLLINSHFPCYNAHGIKKLFEKNKSEKDFIVLNWFERGKLLPEISSLYFSNHCWNVINDDTKIFGEK